ncbi:MAG: regulatory protein RecX [Candidatus Omnitrophica bacterium]|nr:regulatory protein RecX [Candidatus Omnitrophota bacterium]
MTAEAIEKAKAYAYNLLRVQPRSEKELSFRLKKKGFSESTSKETVSLFKKNGLLDDLKFARGWVDARLKSNPKGDIVLRYELTTKGISGKIIDKVLSENPECEEAIAKRLAGDRIKALRGLPKLKAKKRLHDYLARRGFKRDIIEKIIAESWK